MKDTNSFTHINVSLLITWLLLTGISGARFDGKSPRDATCSKQPALAGHPEFRSDEDRRIRGLIAAEAFREELFLAEDGQPAPAVLLAEAVAEFPRHVHDRLEPGRPNLDRFTLSSDEALSQLRGDSDLHAEAAFAPFSGKWYGLWDIHPVDHDWSPVRKFTPPSRLGCAGTALAGQQFAWIGDGFGWNYVSLVNGDPDRPVILGMVYHLRGEPPRIYLSRPHVGLYGGPGKLIWITAKEIFFEETFAANPDTSSPDRYAITGMFYSIADGRLSNVGKGFQAVYTRDPTDRPKWHQFPLKFHVEVDAQATRQ